MKNTATLDKFPKKHIKPYDGMSITAEIWGEAHEEHRLAKEAHNLSLHGSGIITGLKVVANDPPDQYVFISPGAAVDSAGNVIVLPEPVAYDFGDSAEGTLFLLLAHGEREVGGTKQKAKYLQYEFVITARPSLPKRPTVELARVTLKNAGNSIKDADDGNHPAAETLDLRFRNEIAPNHLNTVRVLVLGLGAKTSDILPGWDHLAQAAAQLSNYKLIIDAVLTLPQKLDSYDLIYLGCQGGFSAKSALVKNLNNFIKRGKGLFIEALNVAAEEHCQNLLQNLKITPKKVKTKSTLLSTPYLFNTPPIGFSGNQVEGEKNVIYTSAAYSLAWNGRKKDEASTRADIRSSHEWGINIVHHLHNKKAT